ncbi:MAG TPA: hypothetical protein VNG13_13620 [Mycobacteriales bacterium]|nr:hypothetical protein [Mycobacteriales bacterium]
MINWYKASVSSDATTTAQGMCSAWTQDSKNLIWFSGGLPILDQCAARYHDIQLASGTSPTLETTATNVQYPADVDLNALTNDRAMKYTIAGLGREGYLRRGTKVGIATWDDPNFRYGITNDALPGLAALGFRAVPVAYVTPPASYGDLGSTSASVSSAILHFRQLGIDHVILFDGGSGVAGGGILTLEWMQQAQSQHWYPRYGLDSGSGFNALASSLPQQEMADSVGVSWQPVLDETSSDLEAFAAHSSAAQLCQQIMKGAGQQVSGNNSVAIQFAICEQFFYLKRILDPLTGPLNEGTVLSAIDGTGTSFGSIVAFHVDLNSNRHDGADEVRNMAFSAACTCYQYTGPVYAPGG